MVPKKTVMTTVKKATVISINDTLSPFEEVYPGGLGAVGVEEWVEVLFTMDSGAMITAMNKEECPNVPLEDSQAKKMGVKYEVANGTLI